MSAAPQQQQPTNPSKEEQEVEFDKRAELSRLWERQREVEAMIVTMTASPAPSSARDVISPKKSSSSVFKAPKSLDLAALKKTSEEQIIRSLIVDEVDSESVSEEEDDGEEEEEDEAQAKYLAEEARALEEKKEKPMADPALKKPDISEPPTLQTFEDIAEAEKRLKEAKERLRKERKAACDRARRERIKKEKEEAAKSGAAGEEEEGSPKKKKKKKKKKDEEPSTKKQHKKSRDKKHKKHYSDTESSSSSSEDERKNKRQRSKEDCLATAEVRVLCRDVASVRTLTATLERQLDAIISKLDKSREHNPPSKKHRH